KGWRLGTGLYDTSTWSVRRSDFDEMLFLGAAARGVAVVDGDAVAVLKDQGVIRGVRVQTAGGCVEDFEARVLIDASGQATFLCAAGVTSKKTWGGYDKQVAIFAQVEGAIRDPGSTVARLGRRPHRFSGFA